jgi:hypothetical protein
MPSQAGSGARNLALGAVVAAALILTIANLETSFTLLPAQSTGGSLLGMGNKDDSGDGHARHSQSGSILGRRVGPQAQGVRSGTHLRGSTDLADESIGVSVWSWPACTAPA